MYNNLSFYKEIKGENIIDVEIYKFANKLLFSSDLKFYLDRFSNFNWDNIFLSEEVFNEDYNRMENIFYICSIYQQTVVELFHLFHQNQQK